MGKSEYKKMAELKLTAKERLYGGGGGYAASGDATALPLLVVMADGKDLMTGGTEAFYSFLEGLLVLPLRVVVVEHGAPPDSIMLARRFKKMNGKMLWVSDEAKYVTAADMVLVFDAGHTGLQKYMEKGTVVIGHAKSPFLENYHPNEETGNSFTFASLSPWDVFRAVVRATETYRFPYDWGNIVRGVVKNS